MKKVLEGELTSLAHSILKSKGDNVHELKEKAGLLYEKLCVLSFAEKHFAGKQPNIGKAGFKSAFEMDLDEMITPDETEPESKKESLPIEKSDAKENISTENVAVEKAISEEEQSHQIEASEEKVENSTSAEATSTEKEEEIEQENAPTSTEETENKVKTLDEEESPSNEASQAKTKALTEEDFGVHLDEFPDFEPAPQKAFTPKDSEESKAPKEEIEPSVTSAEEAEEKLSEASEIPSTEKENTPTTEEETPKPQRTMDLFSQDKKSLNDQLKTELKIGLNDRLAFTKKLFDGNVEAYNRVIAKMSEFSDFKEAKNYLESNVKPDYAWGEHEVVEQRFLEILEAKLS